MTYEERRIEDIVASFADIARDQAKTVKDIHRGYNQINEELGTNLCRYPESRINENKIQGWFFITGFSILGIIGIVGLFT